MIASSYPYVHPINSGDNSIPFTPIPQYG